MRRPRPLLPMSSAAAALVVCGTVVALQAGGAQTGVHAVAAAPATTSSSPAAAPRSASTIDPQLTASVQQAMSKATASSYSVVVDIEGLGRVVDINGGVWHLPASTEKLFTVLPLLLDRPGDRLTTTVAAAAPPVGGVVTGDLVVHASADPTLAGGHLAALADQVAAAGVRRVSGRLVLDIGKLPTGRTRSGWKSSYVPWDIGPLSPLAVHQDVWRTTSSYVAHPTAGNLALFRKKLKKSGVAVVGGSAVVSGSSASTVLASRSSPTFAAIGAHTLLESDNFDAEQLLNVQGWGPVRALADRVHADGTATDGSGLSLRDRRTARGEVALLEYAHQSAAADLLLRSLPVACRSGTLKEEMCKTVANGRVFAKTGTLDHVKALAGYTTDSQGRWVTFAMLTAGDTSTYRAMLAIEHAVLLLRHYGS